ncbi:hypothetical protein GL279_16915 [Paracoccus limosus]|uniref:SGNH/GDSL hydrolase family protein n=1 Tax=Paracoccus limosus TaxID=913252 RepID=A0A844H5K2_9RHOB|nr:hypothetical protein [Paracoccus limosus]
MGLGVLGLAILAGGYWQLRPDPLPPQDDGADVRALYGQSRLLPDRPLRVYQLGHSLVGRDMPAMLAQLAGHDYALELGWGASLRDHFQGPQAIAGFAQENDTPFYRDAHEALASGQYDAFVMTEMVRLSDALRYMESTDYAGKWAAEAVRGTPQIQLFLYESWHGLDDQPDWLARIPGDLDRMWSQLLWSAARAADRPVWLIPVGQVMAAVVTEAEAKGIAELTGREQLFARQPDGQLDPIHPGDLGNYLSALVHYAVLYGKSPVGLPAELLRADGSAAVAPSPALARRLQEITWQVVSSQPLTGL